MKHPVLITTLALLGLSAGQAIASSVPAAPNGIEFPADYPDWRVISVSHRIDNNTLRVILGNDIAIEAARSGKTNPWPDGAILGKVVWKQTEEKNWKKAIAPDRFVHAEFMFRDSRKWASNGTGWGWARWVGKGQKPYGKNAGVSQECIGCHTPVKGNDWVFTSPAFIPGVFK